MSPFFQSGEGEVFRILNNHLIEVKESLDDINATCQDSRQYIHELRTIELDRVKSALKMQWLMIGLAIELFVMSISFLVMQR